MKLSEFQRGVVAAADVAAAYDSTSTHPYRLGDCILAKLNVGKRKPRRNRKVQSNAYGNVLRAFDSERVTIALEQLEAMKMSPATPLDRTLFITMIIATLSHNQLEIMGTDHAALHRSRSLAP
jgi:hypothetical protein